MSVRITPEVVEQWRQRRAAVYPCGLDARIGFDRASSMLCGEAAYLLGDFHGDDVLTPLVRYLLTDRVDVVEPGKAYRVLGLAVTTVCDRNTGRAHRNGAQLSAILTDNIVWDAGWPNWIKHELDDMEVEEWPADRLPRLIELGLLHWIVIGSYVVPAPIVEQEE